MRTPSVFLSLALLGLLTSCALDPRDPNPVLPDAIDFESAAHKLVFGPSTGDITTNWVTKNANGTLTVAATNSDNTAGKIAGSEDGITYYFREVLASKNFKLSAQVKIEFFGGKDPLTGLTTSNGQEGFGLMARDFVPQYPGFTLADLAGAAAYDVGETGGGSNMVMVGGIKRGIRMAIRRGVTGTTESITTPAVIPDSSKSTINWYPLELGDYSAYPTLEERPDFPAKDALYTLILEKNNSGFQSTIIPPANKGAKIVKTISEPDVLFSIAKDRYYVGLFAARSAKVEFSNVQYWEYDASLDAPKVDPAPVVYTPSLTILSPATEASTAFKLRLTTNVPGKITVYQDGVPVPGAQLFAGQWMTETANGAVVPYAFYDVPVFPLQKGDNLFTVSFFPDKSADITNSAAIVKQHHVVCQSYFTASTPIYAAPGGTRYNDGTEASPLDIQTAVDFVLPGQTVILKKGTYHLNSLTIARYNSGTFGKPKTLKAETRNQVFLEFDHAITSKGVVVAGDYWVIDGLDVRNTGDKVKGLTLMGNYNILRWLKTYGNADTGLQISGRSTEPKAMWPKGNLVEYCESFNNRDAAENDADGFAAKLTVGGFNADDRNKFSWCVGHNNCDDGWDLFTKKETGEIGVVILENCVAYQNGTLMDGYQTKSGRNGFKMGGEGLSVAHQAINCLAFQNGAHGFTSNSNPAVVWTDCTSFDNGGAWSIKAGADSRNFTIYSGANEVRGLAAKVTGLLSLYTEPDSVVGTPGDDPAVENRREDKVQMSAPSQGYLFTSDVQAFAGQTFLGSKPGVATKNYNQVAKTAADVVSTDAPLYQDDLVTPSTTGRGYLQRYPSGHLILTSFLKPEGFTAGANLHTYTN